MEPLFRKPLDLFRWGYELNTADIQTEIGSFSTKFMLDLELKRFSKLQRTPWVPKAFHASFPVSSLQSRGFAAETYRFD